jgi:hypothetical protein
VRLDPECIVTVFDGENRHRIAKVIGVMAKAGGGRIDFQLVSETALSGEIARSESQDVMGQGHIGLVTILGVVTNLVTHGRLVHLGQCMAEVVLGQGV